MTATAAPFKVGAPVAPPALAPRGKVVDPDETPEVPGSIPRHGGNDRPKIRRADDPTKFDYLARASGFGKPIDDPFLLLRREKRLIVSGIGLRSELVTRCEAVAGLDDPEAKLEQDRIAAEAQTFAGSKAKAMTGSALHKLYERQSRGDDLSFVGAKTWESLQAWARLVSGFKILRREQFVVLDSHGVAGSYDALVMLLGPMTTPDGTVLPAGTILVVDWKTGATIDLGQGAYGTQLPTYVLGVPYEHVDDEAAKAGDNGRRPYPPGMAPNTDWAIIPHIPADNPDDAGLVWVNLTVGKAMLDASRELYRVRKWGDNELYAAAEIPVVDPAFVAELERAELERHAAEAPVEQLQHSGATVVLGQQAERRVVVDSSGVEWVAPVGATDEEIRAAIGDPAGDVRPGWLPTEAELEPTEAERAEAYLLGQISEALALETIDELYDQHAEFWTPRLTAARQARIDGGLT